MDQALALATISVWKDEQRIEGNIQLLAKESIWSFIPHKTWEMGKYSIHIEARLEDLAGNNLNRLFDRDMLKDAKVLEEKEIYELTFRVGK